MALAALAPISTSSAESMSRHWTLDHEDALLSRGSSPSSAERPSSGDSKRLLRLRGSEPFFHRFRKSLRSRVHARNCSSLEVGLELRRSGRGDADAEDSASLAEEELLVLSRRSTEKRDCVLQRRLLES
uniref:Uncharacterized protein n=1 Tax=Ixodes ricinus TaxID=34613 RepID=A0A6B0UQL4_IXORI